MFRALRSTSFLVERHGVGKGEETGTVTGKAGGGGTGTAMAKGEAGANGEDNRGWGQNGVRW